MSEKNEKKNIDEYYASRENKEPETENESVEKKSDSGKIPAKYKFALGGGALIFIIIAIIAISTSNPKKKPNTDTNVIIITLDAVRADSISPFARDKFIFTPNIAELAKKSYCFSNVRTTNPLTLPAHVSMLTGRYPLAHKIRDNRNFRLPKQELSLAEIMKDNGYKTGAFVSAATTAGILGLNQGFDEYDDRFLKIAQNNAEIVIPERRADETIEKSINWLKNLDKSDKFFSWIHLFDAHYPYEAPKDYRPTESKRAFMKDLPMTMQPTNYDAEITYMDICLSKLFNYLVESGRMEDTIIVITSDHGEGLQEHAESTHGYFAYDTTMRIPLIVFFPEKYKPKPLESNANLSIVDIMPTLIDVLKLNLPKDHPAINGMSFKCLFASEKSVKSDDFSRRSVYFESFYPLYAFNYAPVIALRDADNTYLYTNPSELYHTTDANQTMNSIAEVNTDALLDKFRDIFAQFKRQSPGNPFNVA
ncbi:MAG: sulfatase, partial [Planctomycetes bacterium]|nr:sulfatase [Planctomycetota bacterium]